MWFSIPRSAEFVKYQDKLFSCNSTYRGIESYAGGDLGVLLGISFGTRLRTLRQHLGLTQAQLGQTLGAKDATISAYENDEREFSLDFVSRLVREYHVDPRWFFGLIDRIEDAIRPDGVASSTEAIAARVGELTQHISELRRTVRPIRELDEVAGRVMVNEALRRVVQRIYTLDGSMLARIEGVIFGFLAQAGEPAEREKAVG